MGKFTFSLVLIIGFSTYSLACKCSGPKSVEIEYKNSKIILLGKVKKIEFVGLGETMNPDSLEIARKLVPERSLRFLYAPVALKATLIVKKIFKGSIITDTTIIYTGFDGVSCGFRFEINEEYIVYGQEYSYLYTFLNIDNDRGNGFRKDNTYWTNACMRTTEYVKNEQELINKHLTKK